MNIVVAIPSANPGGLQAALGEHFGHCEVYTLVCLDDGDIKRVEVIQNIPHVQGG